MAGTLTIQGMSAGLASGQKIIGPQTMTGSATIGAIADASLVAGDNTFAVPTGAAAVVIFLGTADSGVSCTVRTNVDESDTGVPVGDSGFVVLPVVSAVTEIIVNASGSLPGVELSYI